MSNRASPRGNSKFDRKHDVDIGILFLRRLAPELADVISQAVFPHHPACEILLHQLLILFCAAGRMIEARHNPTLGAISKSGGKTGDVDEALGLADRPLVERRDAGCEGFDKPVEV